MAMIRFSVFERSGDRGHNPLPPAPASSSSTLSPLAPPFTVDRWVPAVSNPDSFPPPPLTGAMSPYFVPTGDSVWSSSSAGASRLTNLNSGLGAVEATPYYPYYAPACDSVDGTLEKLSNYKGYVGGWSGTYDLEEGRPPRGSAVNSSWMDSLASCQMSLALNKRGTADSFSAYEDSFGSWHGAHNESSLTLGNVGSECSEWLDNSHRKIYMDKSRTPNDGSFAELDSTVWPNEGLSYFYSPETTSVVKECDTFIPSSYDRYISQLASCSRDTEVHYPAQTSSLRQACVPSNERNESVLNCVSKHGNSTLKHANLRGKNDDYADYVIGLQNEASIYENAEGGEVLQIMGISGDAMQRNRGSPDSSLQMKSLLLGNSSALGQSSDCLQDVKFGFKVANLSCCNASNSERDAFIPDDSMQTSQEIPDYLNVAVDSPCWKGASVSRRYSFSSNEIVQPLVINVSNGSDDLVQVQRSVKIQSDMEHDDPFVWNEKGKDIDLPPITDLSGSDIKVQDRAEKESNPAKVENAKEIEQHDIHGEHISVLNEQASIPQCIDDHVRQISREEKIICKAGSSSSKTRPSTQNSDFVFNHISPSPNHFSSSNNVNASNGELNLSSLDAIFPVELKKPVSSDPPSKCLFQGQDARVLLKAMLSLSEVLLCQSCNDDKALKECDLKPMQQIIDNLETVILRNRKGITGSSSRVSGVEETQSEVKDLTAGMSSAEVLMDAKENKKATSSGLNYDKHDDIVKSFSATFKVSDGVAQEEDPKILLYKNLWVQTEATLCSLKHDVALMKLELGSLKHLFKAKSQVSADGLAAEPVMDHDAGLNCASSISAENPSSSNAEIEQNHKQNISKNDDSDTTVLARYRILKGRDGVMPGPDEPQRHNAINSYDDREKVGETKELSPKLVDVNTVEKGVLQSHNASSKNISCEKLPALDHRISLNNTESAGGAQESHLLASDGSVIQSYNPKSHGKWLLSSGSGSPSSDEWDHVLKDEFIW